MCSFFHYFSKEFRRVGKNHGVDRHKLSTPVVARYIRFLPTANDAWDSLRVEVYGAKKGKLIIQCWSIKIDKSTDE